MNHRLITMTLMRKTKRDSICCLENKEKEKEEKYLKDGLKENRKMKRKTNDFAQFFFI